MEVNEKIGPGVDRKAGMDGGGEAGLRDLALPFQQWSSRPLLGTTHSFLPKDCRCNDADQLHVEIGLFSRRLQGYMSKRAARNTPNFTNWAGPLESKSY